MKADNQAIIDLLASLDVGQSEAATYAALLHLDSVSIRKVAAETGINRGTTYDALKNLTTLGLVSVRRIGKREHYIAESPEKIYDIIRDKRRDLVDIASNAKELIPNILAQSAGPQGRPLVRYYEGDEGIATILKDVLQSCRELDQPSYYAYSSLPIRELLYRAYPQFTERRIAEDIAVKVIGVGEGGMQADKSERKWLPNVPAEGVSSYTIIYANKIATISIARDLTPYGVVIEDMSAAMMQRLLFEHLWSNL